MSVCEEILVTKSAANTCTVPIRVAHLTSIHPPFDVRIFWKECRTLAEAGYEVILIAPHDRRELRNGIQVEPVPKCSHRWHRVTKTVWQVYRKALKSRASIFHLHDPELLPVGTLLKIAGKRIIYDAHEDLADDILIKHWISPWVRRFISVLSGCVERLAARSFDAVVSATPAIARHFPPSRRLVIQNFPIVDELVTAQAVPYAQRKSLIAYVGSITDVRGGREMIAAVGSLPKSLSAQLLLMGEIAPAAFDHELRSADGWDHVDYLGFQDRSNVAKYLNRARVGLVILHPVSSYLTSQPTKLFEYMSVGIPVIASNFPAWRAFIDEAGCGLTVNPLNVKEIADAILWLLEHPEEAEMMGKRGQTAVRSTCNWRHEGQSLLNLYKVVLSKGTPPAEAT